MKHPSDMPMPRFEPRGSDLLATEIKMQLELNCILEKHTGLCE